MFSTSLCYYLLRWDIDTSMILISNLVLHMHPQAPGFSDLFLDVSRPLLPPLLPLAVLVLEGASDGPSVGVLLPDLQDPLGPPHLDLLVDSALHRSLVRAWRIAVRAELHTAL